MSATSKNSRELLTSWETYPGSGVRARGLGMGHFNATMVIPYMMISPSTTDPKAAQIVLLVQHIQRVLYAMGGTDVPDSGRLDPATVSALRRVVGDGWSGMSWGTVVQAVLAARDAGGSLTPGTSDASDPLIGATVAVGGPLDFLPDVPGGLLTYAVGGFFLYRYLRRR